MKDFKIAVAQIEIPETFLDKNFQFKKEIVDKQNGEIISYIKKGISEQAKVIIFPECSIPNKSKDEIRENSKKENVMIIGGLEYDKDLRNKFFIVAQKGAEYEGVKNYASKYDHPEMTSGNEFKVFINTGFGDIAPLICYDFTNANLISDLRGYVDLIIIIASNPSVNTFQSQAFRICWENFCFIIICNNAVFGGSGVYGPINKINDIFVDRTLWKAEGPVETLKSINLPMKGLHYRNMYADKNAKYSFKNVPAGYEREN